MDIKHRYEIEKRLLHYVEVGDKENALKTQVNFIGNFLYRVPENPLRARKNIAISYNTLLRLSANRGRSPTHNICMPFQKKLLIRIEKAITIQEIDLLEIAMTEEYCDSVANLPLKDIARL